MAKTSICIATISDKASRQMAHGLWRAGQVVAVPTETVYGLAGDATQDAAIRRIYEAKGRPSHNPLICHVASREMASDYAALSPLAEKLIAAFWPGPLTLVLPVKEGKLAAAVTAGLPTVALRCPAYAPFRDLIADYGAPLAAPSANMSGHLSPTCADDVSKSLGDRISLILDDGHTELGIESTIIGVTDDMITLLRPGSIGADAITTACGRAPMDRLDGTITAPGQLKSHYAPRALLRLNAATAKIKEIHIGFGSITGNMTLSADGDLVEAARNLFAVLRAADASGCPTIAVAPIPKVGVGLAINDRLERAAAPRGELDGPTGASNMT